MNHSFHLSQSDLDLILSFFESNSIDISSDKNALKYLSLYVDNKSTTVCTSSTKSEIADVFELIYCLEKGYAKSKKQALGIVYTPQHIINRLISDSLSLLNTKSVPTFLDPACGLGAFLIEAAIIISCETKTDIRTCFDKYIFGIDIDLTTTQIAAAVIDAFIVSKGLMPLGYAKNVLCHDTLQVTHDKILSSFKIRRLDLICTNPPYVKFQNLTDDYRLVLSDLYPDFTKGNFGLSTLFIPKLLELAGTSGYVSMITQNNLFTSLSGEPLRKYFLKTNYLHRVIDFGCNQVFSNASTYTCLMYLSNKAVDSFQYFQFTGNHAIDNSSYSSISYSDVSYKSLNVEKWRLGSKELLEFLNKCETIGRPLGSLLKIRVGFATLADTVFMNKSDSNEYELPDGSSIQIEPKILVKAVKVADQSIDSPIKYRTIIFPYDLTNGKAVLFSEQFLRKNFPNAYKYLSAWKARLNARDKGKIPEDKWYGWGRSQSMISNGPKLLTKTFSKKPEFFVDNSNALFCNGYSLTLNEDASTSQNDFEILRRILNSSFFHYYIKSTSFQIEGDYQCYQKNFIERFCIPLDEIRISFKSSMSEFDLNNLLCSAYNISNSITLHMDAFQDALQ